MRTKQRRISREPEAQVLDVLLNDGGRHRVERMLEPGPLPFDGAPLDVDVLDLRGVVHFLNPERQEAGDSLPTKGDEEEVLVEANCRRAA